MAVLLNNEKTINATISTAEVINTNLPDINYIPGYKAAEEERRSNEETRISNESYREEYFQHIVDEYEGGSLSGATFLPNVNEEGIISWTNNHHLENPTPRNIKGPQGEQGVQGETGEKGNPGDDGISPIITTSKIGKTTTLTIVDADGTKTATILDGADGQGAGDMVKSVYDINDNGIVDNAEKVNNHTVESDVPSNAVFTDTTYTAGTGIAIDNGVISNTQTSAKWGNITGTLNNQTDLKNVLDNKANTSDIPINTSDLNNDSGFISSETDPVFTASAAHGITSNDITNWNNKSDFSGSYNDLTNKPTIPSNSNVYDTSSINGYTCSLLNKFFSALGLDQDTYDSNKSYAVDDRVIHDFRLWECTTACTGTWDETNWSVIPIIVDSN